MSLKNTIDVPFNGQTARCTIEVPLEAIGATFNGGHVDVTDGRIAAFTAKTIGEVLKAASGAETKTVPEKENVAVNRFVDLTYGENKTTLTVVIDSWNGPMYCTINPDTDLYYTLAAYAARSQKPISILRMFLDGGLVRPGQTAQDYCIRDGDTIAVQPQHIGS
ncbi:hypothetical protein LTR36_002360 [Oleoguttula mirabilis]|uniref:Ubiquitin-like domain-containing protein n=1 Tax=Oleoguttula mirabilis TaxID=1507867 RepID=A0AAV9JLN6_9PEZI|nr:hypothetical protein LTR36_002360 [Oleoguttula mirabilis]